MPINYKPISTVKILRSDYTAGISNRVLKEGELAFSYENRRLYIGDSSTLGGIMINTDDSSVLSHIIASTTSLTPYHQFHGDVKKGMVIKAGISGDTLITSQNQSASGLGYADYLDFYELGFEKQRHWMHDHGHKDPFSIAYSTNEGYIRNGSVVHPFPVYNAENTPTGDWTSAYETIYASFSDYTSAIMDGTAYLMVTNYDESSNPPVHLKFKTAAEIIQDVFDQGGIVLDHDILNHTSAQNNHIVFIDGAGQAMPLQYNGAGDGAVLRYDSDTSSLEFTKLRYSDMTGPIAMPTAQQTVDNIGRFLVVNQNYNAQPNQYVRVFHGNPVDYVGTLPQHPEFSWGRNLFHVYSKPENSVGYTPPDASGTPDPENTGLESTSAPYGADAKIYVSSWDSNKYGPINNMTVSDLSSYHGAAILHLHGLQGSQIVFENRTQKAYMGLYSAKDSASLQAFQGSKSYERFCLYLPTRAPVDFHIWTRGGSDVSGNDPSGTMTWNRYGTTNTGNESDFYFSRWGGLYFDEARIDNRTDVTEDGDEPTREAAIIHARNGVTSISDTLDKNSYGVYINFVDAQVLSEAANGSSNVTAGIYINRVKTTSQNLSGETLGNTYGIYFGDITGKNATKGIEISSVTSGSVNTTYGIKIDTVSNTEGGSRGILFNYVKADKWAHGFGVLKVRSETRGCTGMYIGKRETGDASHSTFGIWITNKDIRNDPSLAPDKVYSGTNYSIEIDATGGEAYFGDILRADSTAIFENSTIFRGTTNHLFRTGLIVDQTRSDATHSVHILTTDQTSGINRKGTMIIDATSGTAEGNVILMRGAVGQLGGLWNFADTLAIGGPTLIDTQSYYWSNTYTSRLYLDATSDGGLLQFSLHATYGLPGPPTISYINPRSNSGIAITPFGTGNEFTQRFAEGTIITFQGSGSGVILSTGTTYDQGFPLFCSNGDWTCAVGATISFVFTQHTTSADVKKYHWREIARTDATSAPAWL